MKTSFKKKFLTFIIPLVLIIPLINLVFYLQRSDSMLKKDLKSKGTLLAQNLANGSEIGLLSRDETLYNSLITSISNDIDVEYVMIYDADYSMFTIKNDIVVNSELSIETQKKSSLTEPFFHKIKNADDNSTLYEFFNPIYGISIGDPEMFVGFTRVGMSLKRIRNELTTIIITGAIITILIVFLGIIIALILANSITNPIRKLRQGTEALAQGNFDHYITLESQDEIGQFAQTFNLMTKTIKQRTEELKQTNTQLRITRDNLWTEMELAKKIQTVLLPKNPSMKGYEIAAYMEPAEKVGGDYYDIINAAGRDWLVIGDVSGHGVPAGLIMMMVQTSIQTVLAHNPTLLPADLLTIINKTITSNIHKLGDDKYMTITVLACYQEGKFMFSGIHQDIILYRQKSHHVEQVMTEGMWIGLIDDIEHILNNKELILEVNDVMVLYTDGIVEAWDDKNYDEISETSMFGTTKIAEIVEMHGEKSPDIIKDKVLAALKDYNCNDDVTIMVIKRTV